jgi:hypothetical protein
MKHRPIHLPGSYGLEAEIERRMHPEAVKPRGLLRLWIWRWAAFLTSLGVGLAWLVIVVLVPVVWAVRKAWRAVK